MNQQYPNSPSYPIHQTSQQPLTPSFRPPPNGLPPPSPHSTLPTPTSHTIPRISTGSYVSNYGNDSFVPRTQGLQPSSTISHTDPASQPFSNVYGPTANYYGQPVQNFGHAPKPHPPLQKPRPPSTSALPQSQSQAAYTSALSQGPLRDLAPAPPQDGKPLLNLGNAGNPTQAEDETQPVHVVGSQGRRGILPSAAGRPTAILGTNTNSQKGTPAPIKDSEGKYPCPHCTKHYLHAKHLKRHLLRHSGVRPYTCGLCKDTFSRSDILKRHFVKCSQRRGNPTNENHLSHSRAHRKAKAQEEEEEEAARMDSTTPTMADRAQQITPYTPTSADASFEIGVLNLNQPHYSESPNQVSRSNSVKNPNGSAGSSSNRTSLGLASASGLEPGPANYPRSGHVTPDSAGTQSGAVTPFHYPHESRSNPLSPNGTLHNGMEYNMSSVSMPPGSNYTNGSFPHIHTGQDQHDWNQFASRFYPHDDYGHQSYHSGTNTPLQRVKSDIDISNFPLNDIGSYINKTPSSSRP